MCLILDTFGYAGVVFVLDTFGYVMWLFCVEIVIIVFCFGYVWIRVSKTFRCCPLGLGEPWIWNGGSSPPIWMTTRCCRGTFQVHEPIEERTPSKREHTRTLRLLLGTLSYQASPTRSRNATMVTATRSVATSFFHFYS